MMRKCLKGHESFSLSRETEGKDFYLLYSKPCCLLFLITLLPNV